jgi:hypothetical protein
MLNLAELTGLAPFWIDTMQFAAMLIAVYVFFRWGYTSGTKETENALKQSATNAHNMAMRAIKEADKVRTDALAMVQQATDYRTPKPDWKLDVETGNYLDEAGFMRVTPTNDAELIAMIRATLGISGNDDTLAQLRLRLDADKLEKQQLTRGMETMRGGIAKAGELLGPMIAELQTLRAALKPFGDAYRIAIEGNYPLLPINAPAPYEAAWQALQPKADPNSPDAELAALGVLKGTGSHGNVVPMKPAEPEAIRTPSCPKCGAIDGGDWSQCRQASNVNGEGTSISDVAKCPIGFSPHFDQETADRYAGQLFKEPANDPSTPSA